MPKPVIVYSVSNGEYSDYDVEALFESKEDAQAAADLMNAGATYSNGHRVEEFRLYAAGTKPPVHEEWQAHFEVKAGQPLGDPEWTHCQKYLGERNKPSSGTTKGASGRRGSWARSWTRDRAVKAARDKAAALLDELNSKG